MSYSEPARTAARHARTRPIILAVFVVVGAALIGVLVGAFGYQSLAAPPSSPTSAVSPSASTTTAPPSPPSTDSGRPTTEDRGQQNDHDRRDRRDPATPLGQADGAVPDGVTPFDDEIPGVANLDPELLGAVRNAATDAADDGVGFVVNSGWRSPEYQEHLLREAVLEYGSKAEAARWVSTPETSLHVSGDAIDIGPSEAAAWLSAHGATYGLCQIYGNEPWHYELLPEATDDGCPPMYADPTQDPRMQR